MPIMYNVKRMRLVLLFVNNRFSFLYTLLIIFSNISPMVAFSDPCRNNRCEVFIVFKELTWAELNQQLNLLAKYGFKPGVVCSKYGVLGTVPEGDDTLINVKGNKIKYIFKTFVEKEQQKDFSEQDLIAVKMWNGIYLSSSGKIDLKSNTSLIDSESMYTNDVIESKFIRDPVLAKPFSTADKIPFGGNRTLKSTAYMGSSIIR